MRVVLSVDMEGVSQLVEPNEIIACCDEYWATGKPRLEADVVAACRGLLAGGADEVVVLDNHASGNTYNIWPDALPSGARLEEWNVFDLPAHGVDAMLQVGYHARGDVDGFLSHTYVPGLRLRAGEEPISESHGRAWAAGVPLLGIAGNDRHAETLGSLDGTPFLVVQMAGGGWRRVGGVEYAVELGSWSDARAPLAAAMNAAIAPFLPYWQGGLSTAEAAAAADREQARQLAARIGTWAAAAQPAWFTEPAAPF